MYRSQHADIIFDNHELTFIFESTNVDQFELIDLPMEQPDDSSHVYDYTCTGVGMASALDTVTLGWHLRLRLLPVQCLMQQRCTSLNEHEGSQTRSFPFGLRKVDMPVGLLLSDPRRPVQFWGYLILCVNVSLGDKLSGNRAVHLWQVIWAWHQSGKRENHILTAEEYLITCTCMGATFHSNS